MKSGDDEKLFGSITTQMISDELEKQEYIIDKKEILLKIFFFKNTAIKMRAKHPNVKRNSGK